MQIMSEYDPSQFIKAEEIHISTETQKRLDEATKIYNSNFDGETWYGRCIFVSWYCSLGDCKFCYRSTPRHQAVHPSSAKRSMGSILLEALFCRVFNWRVEFLTGGYGIMPWPEMMEIIKSVYTVYGDKIWLNLGVLSDDQIEKCRPYIEGICASMETLKPDLHDDVCPRKPIAPYDEMFSKLNGFKKSIAVIVGLGEDLSDMKYLFESIEKHKLDRITIYALKPVKGTRFTSGPSTDELLTWLAEVRKKFPKLEIIAGTNLRRCEESAYYMKAGANAITKFPATKAFGTPLAHKITKQIVDEGRNFISNFTLVPDYDWEADINALDIKEEYKKQMLDRLPNYIKDFSNNSIRG